MLLTATGPDGAVAGGTTPTGFRRSGRRRRSWTAAPAPPAGWSPAPRSGAAPRRRIFRLFLARQSLSGLSRALAEEGITARTGRPFSLPGLREILQNPVYCAADRDAWDYFAALGADLCFPRADCDGRRGLLAYQKRDYTGGRSPRNPVDKWIIALGRHPALVSGATWRAVQELLTPDRAPAVHNRRALLSGLLFCARCGRSCFPRPERAVLTTTSAGPSCAGARRPVPAPTCPARRRSGGAGRPLPPSFPAWPPAGRLAREEQRAACRILLQRADWDGAALAFTLCRL
ncbi:MAG: recombinase family protein [Flavonifractor plautii]